MEKVKFLRFGGLSSVKQKHYLTDHDEEKSFHNPPRKKGIYAFPHKYVDKFLLGATNHPAQKNAKTFWIKDENGDVLTNAELDFDDKGDYVASKKLKRILKLRKIKLSDVYYQPKKYVSYEELDKMSEEESDEYYNDLTYYLTAYIKPKIFKYEGEIWHHFLEDTKPGEILDRTNSWILSTYEDYCKIFKRVRHNDLRSIHETWGEFCPEGTPNFMELPNKVYRFSGGLSVAIDHLEVFIEKV